MWNSTYELGLIVIFYSSSFEANAIIAVVFLRERVRYQDVFGKFKVTYIIQLHEKFLQFDGLRAVVFQLNLKYLHVKIINLLRVVV